MNFDISSTDYPKVRAIAKRAVLLLDADYLSTEMDITATHLNGCPLNLAALLDAGNINFAHDVLGIRSNLNRDTGELGNCFLPRYAA